MTKQLSIFLLSLLLTLVFEGAGGYELATVRELESNAPITVIVSEFFDEGGGSAGETTAYIVWREAFEALRDRGGSAVRLALDNEELTLPPSTEEYHFAAQSAAKKYLGNTSVWGVVQELGDDILVWSYVSVLPDLDDEKLSATLSVPEFDFDIELHLPRKSFTFGPYIISKSEIRSRRYVVRIPVDVYGLPAKDADKAARIKAGRVLESSFQSGKWIELKAEEPNGYVEIWNLDILPLEVRTQNNIVPIRDEPSPTSRIQARLPHNSSAVVLDSEQVGDNNILWYQINTGDYTGWAPHYQFEKKHLLPSIHFVAALVRFQYRDFAVAENELDSFLRESGDTISNTNSAAALQLSALSVLLKQTDLNAAGWRKAFELLSEAIEFTPFDPAAFRLRAAAAIGNPELWPHIVKDLEKALELDSLDTVTHDQVLRFAVLFSSEPDLIRGNPDLRASWSSLSVDAAALSVKVDQFSKFLREMNQ